VVALAVFQIPAMAQEVVAQPALRQTEPLEWPLVLPRVQCRLTETLVAEALKALVSTRLGVLVVEGTGKMAVGVLWVLTLAVRDRHIQTTDLQLPVKKHQHGPLAEDVVEAVVATKTSLTAVAAATAECLLNCCKEKNDQSQKQHSHPRPYPCILARTRARVFGRPVMDRPCSGRGRCCMVA
jgi:hypothetical protein